MKRCKDCKQMKPADEIQRRHGELANNGVVCCVRCACPTCEVCGKKEQAGLQIKAIEAYTSTPEGMWYCGPICSQCKKKKRRSAFSKRNKDHLADRCQDCQYPACTKCGDRYVGLRPIPAIVKKYVCKRCKASGKKAGDSV